MIRIRTGLDRADWEFVREVCCRTGDAGEPLADRARWKFFGEQWVGPYEKLRPEWTLIAEEGAGEGMRRLGYLTGCPDTRRFDREKCWIFDLPLDLRIRLGGFPPSSDTERFLSRFEGSFRRPPRNPGPETMFRLRHGALAHSKILERYPAHLHMNLLPEARGKGIGRQLVDAYRAALGERGVPGIHLYCGPKPREFYLRCGFQPLDEIEFKPGVSIYRLGLRIDSG